jgi:hypothetical protein
MTRSRSMKSASKIVHTNIIERADIFVESSTHCLTNDRIACRMITRIRLFQLFLCLQRNPGA